MRSALQDDAELQTWFAVAEQGKEVFEKTKAREGYLVPTDYQMFIAASICRAIAKGEHSMFVMELGAG